MRGELVEVQARGVLRRPEDGRWELRHWPPPPELAPYVSLGWTVEWDLAAPHQQSTLPFPACHLAVEDGVAWLYGPPRRRFDVTLSGRGRVVGLRFTPGGLRPLLGRPVHELTDRRLPAAALPGLDVAAIEAAATGPLAEAVAAVEAVLSALLPGEVPEGVRLAAEAVARLEADRSLHRVGDLADALGTTARTLQRLFADHVGVGPSWVARRFRLQEAALAATSGEDVDWARLAGELGYCDQAHLVRDFTATIGTPPARYAAGAG